MPAMNVWFRILVMAWLINCVGFTSAQQRDREPARCVGKLKGMAQGVLQVETDKGEQMLVAIEARPQDISFQGSATPAFLRPGMLVQFAATLDKKGEAQEEIGTIKVVSQRMGIQLGLQAGGGFAGKELFSGNEDEGGKKKKKTRADAAPYLVTGTLRSINNGKMYVAAGTTVKAELSSNCQVSVDISDISLAREGDSVEVRQGWRFANQSNQLYARSLTITAEKPLGVEEKKRRPAVKDEEKKPATK
jgi:hypothetical protein